MQKNKTPSSHLVANRNFQGLRDFAHAYLGQMVHVIPTLAMRLIAPIFLRPFFFILQLSESETDK